MRWIGENIHGYRTRLREDTHFDKLVDPGSDTDKFLVVDGGKIGYRTGAEVLSDIGGGPGDMTGVDLTAGTGIDISSETNTTSGDYSATLAVDVSDFMGNGVDNRIVTATGTDGMNAEGNLTFDGSTLAVAGKQTITNPSDSGTIALTLTNADEDEHCISITDAAGHSSSAIDIDSNWTEVGQAGTRIYKAINIDFDCDSNDTSSKNFTGLYCDMDYTVGNGATNTSMFGIYVSPTLSYDTDTGNSWLYGIHLNVVGGTNGSSQARALSTIVQGADANYAWYNQCQNSTYDIFNYNEVRGASGYFYLKTSGNGRTTIGTTDEEGDVLGDLTFDIDGEINYGEIYHTVAKSVNIGKADSTDNTVAARVEGVKIPQYAIITKVAAIVKTASNLGTHKVMLTLSTDNLLSIDAEVTNNTELLGAGVGDTDSSDSTSASDIDMTVAKKVWVRQGLQAGNRVTVSADSYLYIANAGTGNGTTDPSSGTLEIYIEYYGLD